MSIGSIEVSVSIQLVVLLLLIGACVKHVSVLDKIDNSLIPPLLIVIALVVEIITDYPITGKNIVSVLITALASASVAIGLHQTGKNIFVNGVFTNLFMNNNNIPSSGNDKDDT